MPKTNDIPKAYDPKKIEDAIYKQWESSGLFKPDQKAAGKPFSIAMPPPNATGTLHLGHAVMLAIEDIMTRYARMQQRPALWVPGTDHASIATENKVEKILLNKKKKTKQELGRKKFLQEVESYVVDSQSIIKNQIRKMGASCDWSRERYTLDNGLSRCVQEVFVKMYHDGLIYRGHRIVNWCTRCQSTLADDEVKYKEQYSNFYYLKYGPVTIGTARPETKVLDKIIVVHPDDKRYKKYVGTTLSVPWIDGTVQATFVADKAADMAFGSGAMTITPAHSFVDFELAQKHGFEIKQIIGQNGKLTKNGGKFAGMDVREAREAIVEALRKKGLVEKIDQNYIHNLSVCYRCDTPIEPLVSKQWFVDVDKKIPVKTRFIASQKTDKTSLKEMSVQAVKSGAIEIIPKRFNKTYFHWMENLHDWCISRQIWFGHRIPVWYKKLSKPVKITYFVHGATIDNEKGKASGQYDVKLSELGIQQSHDLKKTLKNKKFDAVFCSDLKRATDSAKIVFGKKITQDRRLREADYGELERAPMKKFKPYKKKSIDEPFPNGESYKDVEKRMQNFLENAAEKYAGKHIAILAHQAPQFALDVLLHGKTWEQAISEDWRERGEWQPGWEYTLDQLMAVSATQPKGAGWEQDPDTLDTWFSSALWTFSTLLDEPKKSDTLNSWIARNRKKGKDLAAFHPTSVMETGYDILFFWVARMILMTTYTLGEVPFKKVYLHGLVRDKKGRKMSKSLGNGIDPLEMIETFGADATRLSLIIGTTPGNDTRLYEEKIAGYRNFINKIWNIARFILMNDIRHPERGAESDDVKDPANHAPASSMRSFAGAQDDELSLADQWMQIRLDNLIAEVTEHYEKFEYSLAGEKIYAFLWHELADWYLEISKQQNHSVAPQILLEAIKLLHPFTPFITEDIFQRLKQSKLIKSNDKFLASSKWPSVKKQNFASPSSQQSKKILSDFQALQSLIAAIRDLRAKHNLPYSEKLDAAISTRAHKDLFQEHELVVEALTKVRIQVLPSKPVEKDTYIRARTAGFDIYLKLGARRKREQETQLNKEKTNLEQYIAVLEKKLANNKFIKNAPPEIVEQEKQKLKNAQQKLKKL